MKAEELRIRNWIMDRGDKQWQISFWEAKNKVSAKEPEFNTLGMELRGHPLTEYVDFLKPIPLTEEWLLKFGFEKDPEYDNLYNRELNSVNGFTTISIDLVYGIFFLDAMEIKIEHVHQLQNLYFALCGEELILSEQNNQA